MALLSKISGDLGKSKKPLFGSYWLYTLYLAGVSGVSIIVIAVNLGVTLTSLGKYLLITDQEYVLSGNVYEITQCSEARWENNVSISKTPEEIIACEEKATVRAIASRAVSLKEQFIQSFSWVLVFGLLFAFHYPKFVAERKMK